MVLLEIVVCDSSILTTMDHPDFMICSSMENSIGMKRVNITLFFRVCLLYNSPLIPLDWHSPGKSEVVFLLIYPVVELKSPHFYSQNRYMVRR